MAWLHFAAEEKQGRASCSAEVVLGAHVTGGERTAFCVAGLNKQREPRYQAQVHPSLEAHMSNSFHMLTNKRSLQNRCWALWGWHRLAAGKELTHRQLKGWEMEEYPESFRAQTQLRASNLPCALHHWSHSLQGVLGERRQRCNCPAAHALEK